MSLFGSAIQTTEIDATKAKRWSGRFSNKADLNKAATELQRRQDTDFDLSSDPDVISAVAAARSTSVVLDDSQQAAKELLLSHNRAALIGYAGTGKTTILDKVIADLVDLLPKIDWNAFRMAGPTEDSANVLGTRKPSFVCACFTNKAAQNLAAKLPEEYRDHCMSIHSMLAYQPVTFNALDGGSERMRFEPRYDENNLMPIDAIFIDEAGNMNNDLFQNVLAACKPGTRIYLIGDIAQLPPVGGVSPLPFAMGTWPTAVLDTIHRQAGNSPIIYNASEIRQGRFWKMLHHDTEFRMGEHETLPEKSLHAKLYTIKYIESAFKQGVYDPLQDIIIGSMNKTESSAFATQGLNQRFRHMFNAPKYDEKGICTNPPVNIMTASNGVISFAVGDRVMAMNSGGRGATEKRLVTGSSGVITRIHVNPAYKGDMEGLGEQAVMTDEERAAFEANQPQIDMDFSRLDGSGPTGGIHHEEEEDAKRRAASHIITVKLLDTGEEHELSRSAEVAAISIAYVVTAHRFQGSQARNVFVLLHDEDTKMHNREWLYTAVTRAQKAVVLLHTKKALSVACGRSTLLGNTIEDKVRFLRARYKDRSDGTRPVLPGVDRLDADGARIKRIVNGEYPHEHV